jgi:hypothetical protein
MIIMQFSENGYFFYNVVFYICKDVVVWTNLYTKKSYILANHPGEVERFLAFVASHNNN